MTAKTLTIVRYTDTIRLVNDDAIWLYLSSCGHFCAFGNPQCCACGMWQSCLVCEARQQS